MKRVPLSIEEIALISGTRAALGVGVGLLLADLMTRDQRKGAGWALIGVGAVSTIPIVFGLVDWIRSHRDPASLPDGHDQSAELQEGARA